MVVTNAFTLKTRRVIVDIYMKVVESRAILHRKLDGTGIYFRGY